MTPEEARQLLEGTTPGPWDADDDGPLVGGIWSPDRIIFGSYFDWEDMPQWEQGEPEDRRLMAAAPDMASMIANMNPEYSVQLADGRLVGAGWGTRETAECDRDAWQRDGYNARIVCRYVTEPEQA